VRGPMEGRFRPGSPGSCTSGGRTSCRVLRRAGKDAGSDPGRVAQDRDIARIDGDGFVYILDRAKDMINRGGEKIYSLEVENVLYMCPGSRRRRCSASPTRVRRGAGGPAGPAARRDDRPEKIRAFCRTRLADYKVPVQVGIADRIPRNPGGKILKKELRREWESPSQEEIR